MAEVQKVMTFIILITFLVLAILPFTRAYQEHAKTDDSHTVENHTPDNIKNRNGHNKLSPQLLFQITLHGFLLWASMGFLIPVGILVIRMSNREESGRRLRIMFYTHATLQIVSVLLATAAAVLSIRNFDNTFSNNHQRLGLTLYGVIWLQVLTGFIRPNRGSKGRSVWFLVHWSLGTTMSLMGIVNVYTGLLAYHKRSSKSIKLWITFFTAEVSLIVFLYLFQDKWNYIRRQAGVILGDQPVRPTDHEMSPRSEEKKNNDFLT